MRPFDTVVVVDWSAAAKPTPKKASKDALWIAVSASGAAGAVETRYRPTRAEGIEFLETLLAEEMAAGRRVLVGFDFALGYPSGAARAIAGTDDPLALWDWMAAELHDGPDNRNDRFDLADRINARLPGDGPYWGRPEGRIDLLQVGRSAPKAPPLPAYRTVELQLRERGGPSGQPKSVWHLFGNGAVGSQSITGMAALSRLRRRLGGAVRAWPFEPVEDATVVLAEVYPALIGGAVKGAIAAAESRREKPIPDEVQVALLARALAAVQAAEGPERLLLAPDPAAGREGWILGADLGDALDAAARGAEFQRVPASLSGRAKPGDAPSPGEPAVAPPEVEGLGGEAGRRPPPLRDDCFALPPGVAWTAADVALARLREAMRPVTEVEVASAADALGRVLAEDALARRSSPPGANAAVDGYGFAHAAVGSGDAALPLVPGRAAAGAPLGRAVLEGSAVRILTGALLPEGVDTVILQEDARAEDGRVAFAGPVKAGANTRRAGEDVEAGAAALPAGRRLTAPDLALISSLGIAEVRVRARLRVGALSTGDELAAPGETDDPARTYDANRPMLLALLRRWDHEAVDLGHAPDDRAVLRARLDAAAEGCDAVLTSGGASAGEEDHLSALMRAEGRVETWRIAVKPGRPLMLGLWRGVPVFGLPGNPVAAFVCALVFARPALSALAGSGWSEPQGFDVPAAFAKRKKGGRREFLRARIRDGRAEVFASEGSGRVSGLSWAEGLVELPEEAAEIAPGCPVRYLPYGSFGL